MTNQGYKVIVVGYENNTNVVVEFKCGYKTKVRMSNLQVGEVGYPFHVSSYGIGFLGIKKGKTNRKAYACWQAMLQRCYDSECQKQNKTYVGCSVDTKWHNYENYKEFYEKNYIKGFHLDKDLLFKGNKVYSEKNCVFIPPQINTLLIEKRAKKSHYPIGVTPNKKKYVAQITINGKNKYIKYCETVEEAELAYKKEKKKYISEMANFYKSVLDKRIYERLINIEL